MDSLHIMHININGLVNKSIELKLYVSDINPDVICLKETRFNGKLPVKISGYSDPVIRERQAPPLKGGGGVAIYVKSNLPFIDISPDKDDMAAVLIHNSDSNIAIVSYYCPPYSVIDLDTRTLRELFVKHKNCAILGDLNAKHTFYGSNKTDARGDMLFDFV